MEVDAHQELGHLQMRIGPEIEICTHVDHQVPVNTLTHRFKSVLEPTVECPRGYTTSEYVLPDNEAVWYSTGNEDDAKQLFTEMKKVFTHPKFSPSVETVATLSDNKVRFSSDSTHFHFSFKISGGMHVSTTTHPFLILTLQQAYIKHSPIMYSLMTTPHAAPPTKYPLYTMAHGMAMYNKYWEFSVRPTVSPWYPSLSYGERSVRVECRRLGSIQVLTEEDLLFFTQNMYAMAYECIFAEPLLGIDSLTTLSLAYCHLQPDAGKNIAMVLNTKTYVVLTSLDLSHNNLRDAGIQHLTSCKHMNITFDVNDNNVQNETMPDPRFKYNPTNNVAVIHHPTAPYEPLPPLFTSLAVSGPPVPVALPGASSSRASSGLSVLPEGFDGWPQ